MCDFFSCSLPLPLGLGLQRWSSTLLPSSVGNNRTLKHVAHQFSVGSRTIVAVAAFNVAAADYIVHNGRCCLILLVHGCYCFPVPVAVAVAIADSYVFRYVAAASESVATTVYTVIHIHRQR